MRKNFLFTLLGIVIASGLWLSPAPLLGEANCFWMEMNGRTVSNCFGHPKVSFEEPEVIHGKIDRQEKRGEIEQIDFDSNLLQSLIQDQFLDPNNRYQQAFDEAVAQEQSPPVAEGEEGRENCAEGDVDCQNQQQVAENNPPVHEDNHYVDAKDTPSQPPTDATPQADGQEQAVVETSAEIAERLDDGWNLEWDEEDFGDLDVAWAEGSDDDFFANFEDMEDPPTPPPPDVFGTAMAVTNFNNITGEQVGFLGEISDSLFNDTPTLERNLGHFQVAQRDNMIPGGIENIATPTTDATREQESTKIPDKVKGDPVNPYTGGFTYDFALGQAYDSVAGKIPLGGSFRSDRVSSPPGPMGFGTSHTFYEYVTEQGSGDSQVLILQNGDGTSIHFDQVDKNGVEIVDPTQPITQEELSTQFNFCKKFDVEQKFTRISPLSSPVTFKSSDSLITVDKRWLAMGVRTPGQPCRGAWILFYTVRYPTGAEKIFRGVLDTPEMYQDISYCSTDKTHEGARNLSTLNEPTGVVNHWTIPRAGLQSWEQKHSLSCNLLHDPGAPNNPVLFKNKNSCSGDLQGLFQKNARSYNRVFNWSRRRNFDPVLHELFNSELVVNDFGDCIPAHSPIGAALRENNFLVPFHQTMIIDRHPLLRIHAGGVGIGNENPKERHDGWHPFGQQWSPTLDNVGFMTKVQNYRWLGHALGVRPTLLLEGCNGESDSWNCDDRSAMGSWMTSRFIGERGYGNDDESVAEFAADILGVDDEWNAGIETIAHKHHYYRPMDVFQIQRVPAGIVAPLKILRDPRAGVMNIDYLVEWEDFRQYLSYVSDFMGWNCGWEVPNEACDNAYDPTCRAKKISCGSSNWGVRSQTRVEDIQRVDDQIAKTLTMTVRRGETPIATFNYKYALMRDFQLERSMPFNLPADAQTLRNPNHYKPVRTVYYSAPVLQSIEHPGLEDNVTLTYAAPTQNEMCELDEFAFADYQERFVTYDDTNTPIRKIEGTPSPGTTARNRGWTIADQPKIEQENCGSVASGFSPLHFYNQLYNPERDGATSPTYGPQFFSKPIDFENNPMHYYNGPLVLNRVRFNIEQEQVEGEEPLGVRFNFRLENDPENILDADGVSRKNIRLIDVFRGENRPELHLRYDEITGRVYQQQIGGQNSISFDYTLNDDGRNTETQIVTRAGEETTIHYDEEGRITQQTAGDGTSIRYVYNPRETGLPGEGQLKDIIFPNGVIKRHHYLGDRRTGPDNMLINRVEIIPNDGSTSRTTDFSYNDQGRDFGLIGLLSEIRTPDTAVFGPRSRTQYAYDFEVPELNPCNTEKPQGNLVRIIYPDGSFEAWTHNKQGKALEYRDKQGVVTRYDYKPFADDKLNCSIAGILEGYAP